MNKTSKPDSSTITELKSQISTLREQYWVPADGTFNNIDGLPIYFGSTTQFDLYFKHWSQVIKQAQQVYEYNAVTDNLNAGIPNHIGLPIFIRDVYELRIAKNKAKESIRFLSTAAAIEKCGEFSEEGVLAMQAHINKENAVLVAHREYNDLRAYVYINSQFEPIRVHFYNNGLVLEGDNIKIIDVRQSNYKKRRDSYSNPLAENSSWKIYANFSKVLTTP